MCSFFSNKSKKILTLAFSMLLTLSLMTGLAVSGIATHGMASSRVDFTVRAVLPENQIDQERTFFDLKTEPGMAQTLLMEIVNLSDEPIEVGVQVGTAWTNEHGTAEYRYQPAVLDDESLSIRMEDILQFPESIEIPGNESYVLNLELQMPEEAFDGVIAGGISFRQIVDEEEEMEGIRNIFSMLTAILLWQGDTEIEPNPVLRSVQAVEEGRDVKVTLELQNDRSVFLHQMALHAVIYDYDGNEILFDYSRTEMQMAPNSSFEFVVTASAEVLELGESYRLLLVATGQNERRWEFEETFTVTEEWGVINADISPIEEAEEEEEIEESSFNPLWIIIPLAVLFVLVIVAVIALNLYIRKKERDDNELLRRRRAMMRRLMEAEDE